jgi:hypothetical protein
MVTEGRECSAIGRHRGTTRNALAPRLKRTISFFCGSSPTIERFPKSHKFVFGDHILNVGLDVLELLVAATSTRSNRTSAKRIWYR